jgi:hypothetical protein
VTVLAALAGGLHLRPARVPALAGGRTDVAHVAIGRPVAQLPALLGTLHALCAHAHRCTASRAVAAALGRHGEAAAADAQALRLGTARDQVARIAIDWPLHLGTAAQGGSFEPGLRECPLWRSRSVHADALAALPDWLARHWLGQTPAVWLAALEADPARAVQAWCERADGPVAALLRRVHEAACAAEARGPAWRPLDDDLAESSAGPAGAPPEVSSDRSRNRTPNGSPDGSCDGSSDGSSDGSPGSQRARLLALASRLARRTEPVRAGDVVPDTGPWTRARDPLRAPARDAWTRLVSRLVDLVRLAAPQGEHWLAHGAMNTGPRQGLAWTEMARGLLVHWVALEADGARVADLRVLAPTDLNFHPRGVLARALGALPALPARDARAAARLLAVAFDPCVAFDIEGEGEAEGAGEADVAGAGEADVEGEVAVGRGIDAERPGAAHA